MSTVTIGGREVVLERFQVAKAMRVITLLGLIQKQVPELNRDMATFRRQYAADNVVELNRVQAKMRFGPQPVLDDKGEPIFHDGNLLTLPSPIDRMTEQDWQRAGEILKLPQEPSLQEMIMAVFPTAYEKAEQPVLRLVALVVMSNADVKAHISAGNLSEQLDALVESTISLAYLEEIMELFVAVGEMIEGSVMVKAKDLGERVGKLRGLLGTKKTSQPETSPTSNEQPEQPKIVSASGSPSDGDGPTPTPSSDSPGTPSTPSAASLPASV
jgi:hypothetical protein